VDSTSITDGLVVVATLALQILLQLYLKRHFIDTVSQCLEQDTQWMLWVWSAGWDFFMLGLLLLASSGATLLPFGLIGDVPFAVLSVISLLIILVSNVDWGIAGSKNAHHFPTDSRSRLPHKARFFSLFFGYVLFANIIA